MGARPYDPSIGRFLEVDPVEGGSLNNYDYAGQDPINNYDLDGRAGFQSGFTRGIAPMQASRRSSTPLRQTLPIAPSFVLL